MSERTGRPARSAPASFSRRDIVATWLVVDEKENASEFPQTGHDSSRQSFQDIYWRCVLCFFATAVRQTAGARHVLYTNVCGLPNVAGVDMGQALEALGVEIEYLPIKHRLGSERTKAWNNQFYILDILKRLNRCGDYDSVMVFDSDCVWVRPAENLLSDIYRRGILSLSIPYTNEFVSNGASRIDMREAAFLLADADLPFYPHYSGGELFAATRASVDAIWRLAEPMWARLYDSELGRIKIFEEGQFLSLIYEMLDVPTGTADPHCRRMWTAIRLSDVSNGDVFSSRCVWHLPMEKLTGFADLFRIVREPTSWVRHSPIDQIPQKMAKVMGIPKRTSRQWVKSVAARAFVHLGKWTNRS